jgi:hypothetical protein
MVLPILISVAVTPVMSAANAAVPANTQIPSAVVAASIFCIVTSLDWMADDQERTTAICR